MASLVAILIRASFMASLEAILIRTLSLFQQTQHAFSSQSSSKLKKSREKWFKIRWVCLKVLCLNSDVEKCEFCRVVDCKEVIKEYS